MYRFTLYLVSILLYTSVLPASVRLSGYIASGVKGIGEGDTGVLIVDTEGIGFTNLLEIFSAKPNQILETKEDYDFTTTGYEPIASHVTELDFPGSMFASIVLKGGAYFNLAPDFGSSISAGDKFVLVVFANSSTSGNDVLIFSEADWLVPSDGSLSTYSNDLTQLNDLSVPAQTYSYAENESSGDNSIQSESADSGDKDLVNESSGDNSNQSESADSGDKDLVNERSVDNSNQSESADSGDKDLVNERSVDNSNQSESADSGDKDLVNERSVDNSNQSESADSGDEDLVSERSVDNSNQSESADSGDEDLANESSGDNVWYSDSVDLGKGWRWTHWLGYFNIGVESFIYHLEHKWLYVYKNAFRSNGVYFRDDKMDSILWTSENVYPFLYRFADGEWIWYQKGSKDPRWFNKLSKGKWEQH